MLWYVCDVDDGVLRVTSTFREARYWVLDHFGPVLERHKYAPGYYEYVLGYPGESSNDSACIVRADMLPVYGGTSPDEPPLYPYRDRPHEDEPRERVYPDAERV